jgi:hypothetical protein
MYVSRKQLEAHLEPIGEVSRPSKLDKRCHGGGKVDSPDVPDYVGLAKIQAKNNLDAIRAQTAANRVDQYTPYGNLVYSKTNSGNVFDEKGYQAALQRYNQQSQGNNIATGQLNGMAGAATSGIRSGGGIAPNRNDFMTGGDDRWSATITLSPEQQQMLDLQNQIGISSLGQVQDNLSKPFDTSLLPAQMINAGQTAQDAIMSRLEPSLQRRQAALDTQLANQGIGRGTQAYQTAQNEFGQQMNDAYIQAALQGIGIGNQARQQALNEQLTLRNEPLNALNALRTGSQVQNPSFINPAQQGLAQSPDLLGAAQASYGAQLGASNAANANSSNFMSGLMGLGGYALGGPIGGMAGGFLGGMF